MILIERRKLKSLIIDVENNIYELNGEPMKAISEMRLDFNNGKWTLTVSEDIVYEQSTPDKAK